MVFKHAKTYGPHLVLRSILVFLVAFTIAYGLFNYRFLIEYARFKLSEVQYAAYEPDKGSVVHLPVSEYRKPKPLPQEAEIIVDRIRLRAPIVFGVANDETTIFNSLEKGVVNYPETVKPGEAGLSLLLGHSSAYPWYRGNYGSVFALLGQLKKDDIVYIRYKDGRTFTYKIYDSVIFSPFDNDHSYLQTNSESNLVLLSCWPVSTNYKRIAIKAMLI